jgi:hypothetical protein
MPVQQPIRYSVQVPIERLWQGISLIWLPCAGLSAFVSIVIAVHGPLRRFLIPPRCEINAKLIAKTYHDWEGIWTQKKAHRRAEEALSLL